MNSENCGAVLSEEGKACSQCEFEDKETNETETELTPENNNMSKKTSALLSLGKISLCIFLSIVLVALSVGTGLIFTVRKVLGNEKLSQLPSKIDPIKIMKMLDIDTIDDGDKGDVRKTYRRLEVTKYMGYALKKLGSDILAGNEFAGVDIEDIYRNVETQLDEIKEETGYEISKEELKKFLEDNFDVFFRTISGKVKKTATIYEEIGAICSVWSIVVVILVQLGLMALIFLINKWRLRSMIWISSALILGAAIYATVLGLFGTTLVTSYLPSNEIIYDVVEILFGFIFWDIINIGVAIFACGLIMLVATLVAMKLIKMKKLRAAENN